MFYSAMNFIVCMLAKYQLCMKRAVRSGKFPTQLELVYAAPFFECLNGDPMQKLSFSLNGEFIELNQLLKLVGICESGGAGKVIVASGDVSVDGQQELRKTAKIRAGQIVRLGDVEIRVLAD